eukprot:5732388-Pleurochrysis_carterae.AAC.1
MTCMLVRVCLEMGLCDDVNTHLITCKGTTLQRYAKYCEVGDGQRIKWSDNKVKCSGSRS